VCLTPRVGAERGVVGFAGGQTSENVPEVGPDVQVIAQRTAHQGEKVRGPFPGRDTADEQPNLPVMLSSAYRKNWLLAGSDNGGRTAATLFSLIATCERHRVEPTTYFRDVLNRIAAMPINELPGLLPDRWKPATTD